MDKNIAEKVAQGDTPTLSDTDAGSNYNLMNELKKENIEYEEKLRQQ